MNLRAGWEGGHGSSSPSSAFADEKVEAGADEDLPRSHGQLVMELSWRCKPSGLWGCALTQQLHSGELRVNLPSQKGG